MSNRTWDVVVVGAGPAGAAVASRLARCGHAVLLLDREEFPRSKPCGECLNPAAVGALDALGALDLVLGAYPAVLHGWQVQGAGGASFRGRFPAGCHGLALPRVVLDALLVQHARAAGAEVRTGLRVLDVAREADGRVSGVHVVGADRCPQLLRCRLVVGADGVRSVVSRRLGLIRRPPRLRKLALTAHVEAADVEHGLGVLQLAPSFCAGAAAVGAGLVNVTVVVGEALARQVAGDRGGFFDAALRRVPRLAGARRVDDVRATGPFDWPVRRAVADGVLLVGDAAGYYDPFTGQGIYRALRGAELAAETADHALRADRCTAAALLPYERARRRAFAPGVAVQHLIEACVARPRLLQPLLRLLDARPLLGDTLVAVTGDVAPVHSLLAPRVLAAVLG